MRTRHIAHLSSAILGICLTGSLVASAQTLESALDNDSLSWTTSDSSSTTAPWSAFNSTAASDSVDYAQSGYVPEGGDSYCRTTVNGPGVVSFWWRVYSDEFDFLEFTVESPTVTQTVDFISNDTFFEWEFVSYEITNTGPVNLKWNYTRDPGSWFSGYGQLDQVRFISGPEISLSEAVNTSNSVAVWTTGGNTNQTFWAGQTNTSRLDGMAAESGAVKQDQESWMQTTVSNVTSVSFWWKISSVTSLGVNTHLALLVNGATNAVISGEVDWQGTNVSLSLGANTLRWVYYSDDLCDTSGRGWVDEVVFSPDFGPSSNIMLSTPVVANGTVQFAVTNKIGWPCDVYYSTNLAANEWTLLLSTNTTSSATFEVTDPTAGNSPFRYYRAVSY